MIIDLNEKQKELLLETLGIVHAIRYMKGEDNSDIAALIEKVTDSLREAGEMRIFHKVFQEHKK